MALVTVGEATEDVNEFGPVQLITVPPVAAGNTSGLPEHRSIVLVGILTDGVVLTVRANVAVLLQLPGVVLPVTV